MYHYDLAKIPKKIVPYLLEFPNDFTCWHFPKKGKNLIPSEVLHLVLVTARHNQHDVYDLIEIEKGLLTAPERHKRRIRAKIAWLKRKMRGIK